jgi:hypothetical protein
MMLPTMRHRFVAVRWFIAGTGILSLGLALYAGSYFLFRAWRPRFIYSAENVSIAIPSDVFLTIYAPVRWLLADGPRILPWYRATGSLQVVFHGPDERSGGIAVISQGQPYVVYDLDDQCSGFHHGDLFTAHLQAHMQSWAYLTTGTFGDTIAYNIISIENTQTH